MPFAVVGFIITALFFGIYSMVFSLAGQSAPLAEMIPEPVVCDTGDMTLSAGLEASAKKSRYVFLAAGQDAISGLTDVLLLISFDTVSLNVNIVQIPRDTYYNYTSRAYRKINGASYALGGLDGLAQSLEQSMGIEIDYTIRFTLEAFAKMVDLIDGVPVNIPYDMDYDDPSQNLHIHLKAGGHVLDGDEAVQFVRFRSGYVQGDIGRTDAQKIFLAALARRITEGVSLIRLPSLIRVLIGDIQTDMSFNECLTFAQTALNVSTSNITLMTMSGSDARTRIDSGAWYYIINRAAAIETVNKYFRTADNAIDDAGFDTQRLFTNSGYSHFDEIYDAAGYVLREYNADDINTNGIGINLTGR